MTGNRHSSTPLRTKEQEAKHGVETIVVSCLQEIQTAAILQKNDINILLGKMKATILTAFQAHGETVNSAMYCTLLQYQLKLPICHTRQGLLSKGGATAP